MHGAVNTSCGVTPPPVCLRLQAPQINRLTGCRARLPACARATMRTHTAHALRSLSRVLSPSRTLLIKHGSLVQHGAPLPDPCARRNFAARAPVHWLHPIQSGLCEFPGEFLALSAHRASTSSTATALAFVPSLSPGCCGRGTAAPCALNRLAPASRPPLHSGPPCGATCFLHRAVILASALFRQARHHQLSLSPALGSMNLAVPALQCT